MTSGAVDNRGAETGKETRRRCRTPSHPLAGEVRSQTCHSAGSQKSTKPSFFRSLSSESIVDNFPSRRGICSCSQCQRIRLKDSHARRGWSGRCRSFFQVFFFIDIPSVPETQKYSPSIDSVGRNHHDVRKILVDLVQDIQCVFGRLHELWRKTVLCQFFSGHPGFPK